MALVAICSCGPSGGGGGGVDAGNGNGDGGGGLTLEVTPADALITVTNGVAAPEPYTAVAHFSDGTTMDVSSSAIWVIDDLRLGLWSGSSFAASGLVGGGSFVRASFQGATTAVPVTVKVSTIRVIDPAPANAADLFGAASEDPARAPTTAYPADQTMVPPNLGDFEVHWTDAAGNDLFEVSLTSPYLDLRTYVSATSTGWVAFLPAEWAVAGETQRGASLKVVVRGLSTAAPATAGSSAPLAVNVARDDILGGIYYWAASASGVYRHDFGKPGEPAEQFFTPTQSGGRCIACHALSKDGTRMAITYDGGGGGATVLDVATRTPLFPEVPSNFSAFEPTTGALLLTTSGGTLTLRDATNGAALQTVPTPGYATHPDWAPAGDKICYVVANAPSADWYFTGGHLYVQPFDATTNAFGPAVELVPAGGQNIYYPTFSPDGQWILYNQSNEDAYNDVTAQIYAVPVNGSLPPQLVATADLGAGLTNSWPRWAPFETETGGEMSEPFFWFTISSTRAFGVRMAQGTRPQIWMAPFFPGRATITTDAAKPMFRLPFQDLGTSNHIAQWTETVVPID